MTYFCTNREFYFPSIEEQPALPKRLLEAYTDLLTYGDTVEGRIGATLELTGVSFSLFDEDIREIERLVAHRQANTTSSFSSSPFNNRAIKAEHIAVLGGKVGPIGQKYGAVPGAKYSTLIARRGELVAKLEDGGRQAVLLNGESTCWSSVQLLNRSGRLSAVLTARSVDAYNGLVPDILFWHRFLVADIAERLNLRFQGMTLNIGSFHIHKKDVPRLYDAAVGLSHARYEQETARSDA